MPVPTSINDLSSTPSGNGPSGTSDTPSSLDDYQRAIQAILKSECGTLLTAGGTPNAISVTTTPTFAANVTGKELWILASAANTGAVTLNVNGIGAVAVNKNGSSALGAGDIPAAGAIFCVKYDGTQFQLINTVFTPSILTNPAFCTNLLYPSQDGRWRDIYRAGWMPNFNQQWGGVWYGQIFDSATGLIKDVEVIAGNIQFDNATGFSIGFNSSQFQGGQSFVPAKGVTNPPIALKLSKTGNPTDNIVVGIYSDNADKPNVLIGSTASLSGKQITSKLDGEFYIFNPAPGALTAGTKYWIVVNRSGATDMVNFYNWPLTQNNRSANQHASSATSAPVWTTNSANCCVFLVSATAVVSVMQSGGRFDQKLVFSGAGSPIDQTDYLWQPLRNFWDGRQFTSLIRLTAPNASQPIKDFQFGVDHDRILVSINGSGFAQVDVWDSGGTKRTVTGAGSITSGDHDIGVSLRAVGDGSDYIRLFVDGVSVGTSLTGQTLTFDPAFRESGTATLGGAMLYAVPTWTQNMTFGSLPSAQGWTWTGTATEANAMSVAGNKLYQNANGYTSAQTGSYAKTAAGLSNFTGWTVSTKMRVGNSNNNTGSLAACIQVFDGTKNVNLAVSEFYIQSAGTGVIDTTYFDDFRSRERVFTIIGKGSDYFVYVDGRMVIDGTGKLTAATATNQISFGDNEATASYNDDAIWSYMKYWAGGAVLPQFTSGSLSENLEFSGNREVLLPSLWNAGSPISGKSYLGIGKNYVGESVIQKEQRYRTTLPTTSSTTSVLLTDMELFTIGSEITTSFNGRFSNNTANDYCAVYTAIDGRIFDQDEIVVSSSTANAVGVGAANNVFKIPLGLHRINMYWAMQIGGTGTCGYSRLATEAKA